MSPTREEIDVRRGTKNKRTLRGLLCLSGRRAIFLGVHQHVRMSTESEWECEYSNIEKWADYLMACGQAVGSPRHGSVRLGGWNVNCIREAEMITIVIYSIQLKGEDKVV